MKDTAKMTVPELKARAKELGLCGFSKLKKAELLKAVNIEQDALASCAPGRPPSSPFSGENDTVLTTGVPELGAFTQTGIPANFLPSQKEKNKAKARRRKLRNQGFPAGF